MLYFSGSLAVIILNMNKLNALKYFCFTTETLQFRKTALRLSVLP